MSGVDPPRRVRITSPQTAAARRRTPRPVATDIDAQTELGAVFMRSLLRAQLRLAAGILILVGAFVGGLPLLFRFVPGVASLPVLGMPLAWGLLGFIAYPVMWAMGWAYVRRAEHNERTFVDMVEES